MGTKILIDTPTFEAILARHPEVEVDLLHAVVPQIAARIGDRIKGEIAKIEKEERAIANGTYDTRLREALTRQLARVGDTYGGVSDGVRAAIRVHLKTETEQDVKTLFWGKVDAEIARRLDEAFKHRVEEVRTICQGLVDDANARIDAQAKAAAEREVMALLRAGKLTVAA